MPVVDARHLDGISETALLTLYQRAAEAARPDGIIDDPMAIVLRDSLDYDYPHFGRTHQGIALRALAFDNASREYLAKYPRATVVALADGLQTSFWRLDNGELTWLSVDLAPIVRLRQQLLPVSERLHSCAQSALVHSWMDQVDATHGVLITAEGLFQYLERDVVFDLIA
ncbi:MAG: class I SAM-dependent methyltransferase, partial [Mycobacteriaceae bacterium]|nr:class I SAM-dependent methyltransferase [Mycobacteriaceae bacterium]